MPNREWGMSDQAVAIDRIKCDGYGSCAELLPEMIDLDDWGYPIIRPGAIPEHLLPHARMAVDTCPVLALRLVEAARATPAGHHNRPPAPPSVTWAPPSGRERR
jgi:ferredoxin